MDSMPNGIFYARSTPTIKIKYKDYRELEEESIEFIDIDSSIPAPWRDIAFMGEWNSENSVEAKYYHYYLYQVDNYNNEILIAESSDIYDYSFSWDFKGLDTNKFYKVKLSICDKYGNHFSNEKIFYVEYRTYTSITPLNTALICEEQGIRLESTGSVYVASTDKGEE